MENKNIRNKILSNCLKYWQVAEAIGITDGRLSVWLRTSLNDEREARVLKAIEDLIKKGD